MYALTCRSVSEGIGKDSLNRPNWVVSTIVGSDCYPRRTANGETPDAPRGCGGRPGESFGLLDLDFRARVLQLLRELVGFGLGDARLDDGAGLLGEVLRLLEAEVGRRADDLDDVDLVGAGVLEDDVERRLLLRGGRRGAAGRGRGHHHAAAARRLDAQLLLERLDRAGNPQEILLRDELGEELGALGILQLADLVDETRDIAHGILRLTIDLHRFTPLGPP